jgi:hypothetical protein
LRRSYDERSLRAVVVVGVVAACGTSDHGTHALYAPTSTDFYAVPYPNDLRRHADGTLDLSKLPTNAPLVDQYRMAAETLDGFSLNAPMFVRFDDVIDPASLPDPKTSMQAGASVYVVNVTPASPHFGALTPIIAKFHPEGTNTIGKNRLAVRPFPGFGLDEATTYALVVTSRVHAMDGTPIEGSSELHAVLGGGGSAAEKAAYAPLVAWVAAGNEPATNIVTAAVFTTQHATFAGTGVRKGVFGTTAPVAASIAPGTGGGNYNLWTGTYTAPNFQTGTVPYLNDGGEIQFDANGVAIVQRMEPMRFALTVPLGAPPSTGWPFAIYQHGTGGDWQSFINDGTGARLAAQGIATISTDQVLHGPRNPGGDPEVDFFNFGNPLAGRDNALQGAADAWNQLRLATGLSFPDGAGNTVSVDPARAMFFGHSQGGLTGPPFVAFEPTLKGAVLSGTGGLLYLGALYKMSPISFEPLIESLGRDLPVDEDNPSLALLQMWAERTDGANYARYFVREPQTSGGARAIYQSEGFVDTYAPNPGIEAFATAVGGDLVLTSAEKDVAGFALRNRGVLTPPITNNINGTTAVLAQYTMRAGSDGHFVVFEVPLAEDQSAQFLGTLASPGGQATVVSQ